jgi:hypothetical protein
VTLDLELIILLLCGTFEMKAEAAAGSVSDMESIVGREAMIANIIIVNAFVEEDLIVVMVMVADDVLRWLSLLFYCFVVSGLSVDACRLLEEIGCNCFSCLLVFVVYSLKMERRKAVGSASQHGTPLPMPSSIGDHHGIALSGLDDDDDDDCSEVIVVVVGSMSDRLNDNNNNDDNACRTETETEVTHKELAFNFNLRVKQ